MPYSSVPAASASRNASVKDPAGNLWTIATHQEDLTPEELAERAKKHMR